MRRVELCKWFIPSSSGSKMVRSTWKMTREDALAYCAEPQPVPGTAEFIEVPETEFERLQVQMNKPRGQ